MPLTHHFESTGQLSLILEANQFKDLQVSVEKEFSNAMYVYSI